MSGWIHHVNWGDAPTWLGAVFAGAAASIALLQLGRQRKELGAVRQSLQDLQAEQLDLQLEPERLATRRARRRQAEQVRCSRQHDQVQLTREQAYGPTPWDYLLVTNTSGEPIRTVEVSFGGKAPFRVGQLEPRADGGGLLLVGRPDQPVAVIDPGASWCFLQPGDVVSDLGNEQVLVRFDDANGVRWQARLTGQLDEVPDPSW